MKPSYSIKTFRATDNWTTEDKSREAIETGLIFLVGVITIDLVYGWFLEFSLPTDEFNLRVKDLYDTEARRKQEKRERRKLKTQEESLSQLSKSLPARIAKATIATVTPWKIVDLMILSLFVAQYAVRAGYLSNNQDSLNAKAFDGTKFTDFQQEMLQYKITINIDVVLIFFINSKDLHVFSYNPNISMIWIILQKSAITFVHSFMFTLFTFQRLRSLVTLSLVSTTTVILHTMLLIIRYYPCFGKFDYMRWQKQTHG